MIVDQAETPPAVIDSLAVRLEVEYARVKAFLPEFKPPDADRIVFNLRPGPGIPFVNIGDGSMNQWLTDGEVRMDYIPHQLTHLWTRYLKRPFLEEGLAVYVTEELEPEARNVDPYRGQPSHAWMSFFEQQGSAISLFTAWRTFTFNHNFMGSPDDAFAWQIFVEGGSFTRWMIETHGRDKWLQLYVSEDLGGVLGQDTPDIAAEWARAVVAAFPSPNPDCEAVLADPPDPRVPFWCARARGTDGR